MTQRGRKTDKNYLYVEDHSLYYVYGLFRPDGTPFYIGKGQGNRINHHFRPSFLKKNTPKTARIKHYGDAVKRQILCFFAEEESAYEMEEWLISQYGVVSEGGCLVNYAKTRSEYFESFAQDVASQGVKSRARVYTEQQIKEAYILYFEELKSCRCIAELTNIPMNYLYYLFSGRKAKDYFSKYIESGLIQDLRPNKKHVVANKGFTRGTPTLTQDKLEELYKDFCTGRYTLKSLTGKYGISKTTCASLLAGHPTYCKDLYLLYKDKFPPRKVNRVYPQQTLLDIKERILGGASLTDVMAEFGISKTHYYRLKKQTENT